MLLVLINRARVIGYHDGLPHAFDPDGHMETPVRIKFTSEFARRSHGVFEPTQQPSNEHPLYIYMMDDVTFENPTFEPEGPGDDDYSFDLHDPAPSREPPPDVQQQFNASGDNLQNLAGEAGRAGRPEKSALLTVSTTR